MGKYNKAIEVLEEAIAVVEDEDSLGKVRDKLREIEEKKQEALKPVATATTEPTATPTPEPTATPTLEPTATPTSKPTATPTPKPTATPIPEPTATPMPSSSLSSIKEIENAAVGEYVKFGTYEQDNNLANGAEDIEWLVLEKQDGKALLLGKYALDAKPYNEEGTDVTWESCTLRSWLNEEFYEVAFTEKERSNIAETLVVNEDNQEYGTEGGNDTRDKVFLLSIDEVTTYFDSDQDAEDPARRAQVTEYAKAQGGFAYSEAEVGRYGTTEYDGNGFWWLRSPGDCSIDTFAAVVHSDGHVQCSGNYVGNFPDVVRPALWIAY